jgi:hypothetical protein
MNRLIKNILIILFIAFILNILNEYLNRYEYYYERDTQDTLVIVDGAGFFSCCSVRIYKIIEYFSKNKRLPYNVDTSKLFSQYKIDNNIDITHYFFEHYHLIDRDIMFEKVIPIDAYNFQFTDYKKVDYSSIIPFVKKYFTPTKMILDIKNKLILKYKINSKNCICIYYRGTDKIIETDIDDYETFYLKLMSITKMDTMQVLIQTDSAQFLDYIKNKNLKNVIIINENSTSYTNNGIHNEKTNNNNFIDIQYLLATFLIISESKYIICTSGNGSIWIIYFRGNANNVYQNLNRIWY